MRLEAAVGLKALERGPGDAETVPTGCKATAPSLGLSSATDCRLASRHHDLLDAVRGERGRPLVPTGVVAT